MDFGLSEEQELLQETVRTFVENECPAPRLRELFDAGVGHDSTLWNDMAEMGLAGLLVPENHGGAGLEMLELALVSEELGYGSVPGPFLGHALATVAILEGGSEAQKEKWLPGLASGETIGTFAAAEENSRWDPSEWSVEEKDGELSGAKQYVPNADVTQLIVTGCSRGRLAVVERDADGVQLEDAGGIDRSRPVFHVRLDGVAAEMLEDGQGASTRVRDAACVLLAADSFGLASKLIRISTEYAKTREQFGTIIGQFQAVKHQLARLATDIEPTRGLFWFAAHAFDHLPEQAEHVGALAKAHITDRAMNTARQSVELHGGLGFTWECDVQMYYKRAMFNRAAFGTPDAVRARIATLGGW
ncbi:MAG: acyl-CoA dehydrogenase family protein [Myxococcota bacterium]|jgi:alkylation response protein AidB-like acyl-CoA dehydrogenase|nr:acyl-CoA dehydrogenase family protein [Myxococcota bacterium]